ncbi:L,D-transpeptidase [Paracoccus sp. (in: a-proteobacteria)]|uniref:L,D-transpeptidase n=1 Tax=Paracoccus sp. TaxID=267 RepID=UPI00272D3CC5|nr:L,D-transpeptidase [Paracoccus sp. (in: a-proteobacteria)]
MSKSPSFNRRAFLGSAAALGTAGLAAPALAQFAEALPEPMPAAAPVSNGPQHNISSFRMQDWRPYFQNLSNGAILCDLTSRALHYWSEDQQTYRLYPSSIPVSEDLTRTGRTEIIRKVEGPSWAPTPAMKARNPDWPDFVPPGPDNPLGTHALWLSWQYYRIHGTHDTRKIGRRSSNGCIGLYNEHIAELYNLTKIGTQVLII